MPTPLHNYGYHVVCWGLYICIKHFSRRIKHSNFNVSNLKINLFNLLYTFCYRFVVDLLNILQGILIFLVLVVFRKSVRRSLATKRICNIRFPNSWKYLEDEEMESAEEKANSTIITYEKDGNVQENVQLNS